MTFGTDELLRNVVVLLKMRAKRSSYDQPFLRYDILAVSGGFRRFSAVLVLFVIL